METIFSEIGDFIFKSDELRPADIIFMPGGSFPEVGEQAARLFAKGLSPLVVPSGKYSVHNGKFNGALSKKDEYPWQSETESEFLSMVMQKNGVPQSAIICEDNAVSTYDNARFTLALLEEKGIEVHRAILCCKSIHARRAYMYYQFYFPNVEIMVSPVDIGGINKSNWANTPEGMNIVFKEMEKCAAQIGPMLLKQSFPEVDKANWRGLY
ncbi:MAG: YdcF family protein [Oscillospiraceae bacterium]